MRSLVTTILIAFSFLLTAQHQLIPTPVQYQATAETFTIDRELQIVLTSTNEFIAKLVQRFSEELRSKGYKVNIEQGNWGDGKKGIYMGLNTSPLGEIGDEGYTMEVRNAGINLKANKSAGLLNGIQTLRQLFPVNYYSLQIAPDAKMEIPGCRIKDYPRFEWRGLMLDVSRHFFSVADVKKYIDAMVEYKLNVFHWHLVDDNGWRVEIKSMPKLTEIGAWRVERHGRFGNRLAPKKGEATPYGGFYTQAQIKDVVQYAADRNITIVPEIDVPGHSMALLAAYPELSTKKEAKQVNPGTKFAEWYGNHEFKMLIENTVDPSNEAVYEAMDKIFGEIAQLFPGQYIHMGGDEAYHGYWEEDSDCKALMKKEGLKGGGELQSYFVKRIEKIINKHGKDMIGWDEILEGGLAEGAAVMSWRGMKGGIAAAKMGHKVVMSPTTYAYLDYSQSDHTLEIPIYSDLRLKTSYSFEPVQDGVDPNLIMGAQGNLWTEQIPTLDHAFYMTYPRAFAIAETGWSPKKKKNWSDFFARVEHHYDLFDAAEKSICKASYDPIVEVKKFDDELRVTISSEIENVDFFYTTDHTFPNKRTPKYNSPITIPEGQSVALKVAAYRNGQPIGRLLTLHRDELLKRAE